MSCECQVANADPSKPCASCGEAPSQSGPSGAELKANETARIEMLLKMTRRSTP